MGWVSEIEGEMKMDGVKTIEELQAKLAGVFDLSEVDDCRKIIGVLLRSMGEKESSSQSCQNNLKMLAMMVVNGNPEARDKATEVLTGSRKSKNEMWDFLVGMAKTMEQATSMTTEQIISEVMEKVWSPLDMSSRESAVLGELIFRTRKLIGAVEVCREG